MISKLLLLTSIASIVSCLYDTRLIKHSILLIISIISNELFTNYYFNNLYRYQGMKFYFLTILKTSINFLAIRYSISKLNYLRNIESFSKGQIMNNWVLEFSYRLYGIIESVMFFSFWINVFFTLSVTILYPILASYFDRQIINFERLLNRGNINITYRGINIIGHTTNTLSNDMIEKIAPLRCAFNKDEIKYDKYLKPENCLICMDIYDEDKLSRILPCGHAFHASCVDQWLMNSNAVCPVCRLNLKNHLKDNLKV
jgi:hypothetical protein